MKKTNMVRLTVLLLLSLTLINVFSSFMLKNTQLSKAQVIDKFMEYSLAEQDDLEMCDFLETDDGSTFTEKSLNPTAEMMSITTFPDGSAIYGIFDTATELSYKIHIPTSIPSITTFENAEMTVTDITALREKNTVRSSDIPDPQLRPLMAVTAVILGATHLLYWRKRNLIVT